MDDTSHDRPHFRRKRLNLAVKNVFQMWLLKQILVAIGISSAVVACILFYYSSRQVTTSFVETQIVFTRVSDVLLPVILTGSIVSLVAGMTLAAFLPQKIAGAIYRVEQDLEKLQQGDLTAIIKQREGDILPELVAKVNQTTASLRDRVQALKNAQTALEELLPEHKSPALIEALNHTRRALDDFRT